MTKEKQSQMQRANRWLPEERGVGGTREIGDGDQEVQTFSNKMSPGHKLYSVENIANNILVDWQMVTRLHSILPPCNV